MDSISEIEEAGQINRYLITRGVMDKIKRNVRKFRGTHSAESEYQAQLDQSEAKQNSLEKQIKKKEGDKVVLEGNAYDIAGKIEQKQEEISGLKKKLKAQQTKEDSMSQNEDHNEEAKDKEQKDKTDRDNKRNLRKDTRKAKEEAQKAAQKVKGENSD